MRQPKKGTLQSTLRKPDYSHLIFKTKKGGVVMHIGSEKIGKQWFATIKNMETNQVVVVTMEVFENSIVK
jgi:hypothetical protein